MATAFGSLGEYLSKDSIVAYLARLDAYFVAYDIGIPAANATAAREAADRKKVVCLISIVGAKTYSTLQDLCTSH